MMASRQETRNKMPSTSVYMIEKSFFCIFYCGFGGEMS